MKLLLFSDLHADTAAAHHLVEQAAGVDVVIGAGDFGNQHRQVGVCLNILRAITQPAILVAGNNETTEELTEAARVWPSAHVLHGTGVILDEVPFFGLGGGIPVTPFGSWSYDFTETQAEKLLADAPLGGVMVSHSPPKGAVDCDSRGRSLGSTALAAAITRLRPRLVVCGHIHGSAGQIDRLGETTVINAGPGGILWPL